MIKFKPISDFRPGQIQKIIKSSYERLFDYFPNEKQRLHEHWENEDKIGFQNPNGIGSYVLFTCVNDCPVGYFSWDDRQFPKGIIGQNCIIPEYQNNGYGTKQIEKLIENFKKNDFKTISVETGDHNFFIPAQKMYEKCGFTINQKREGDLYDFIEYALNLE